MSFVTLVLFASLAAALAGSWAARAFALRFGIVNQPNPHVPQHVTPTAYLGGVGVLVGLAGGATTAALSGGAWPAASIAVPAALFCLLGLLDDLQPFTPWQKLVGQVAIAALAAALGLRLRLTGIDTIDGALAALWIVTCVNAFNLTDVCDGLVTGLAAAFFLGWICWRPGPEPVAIAAFGACIGFLFFNAPRASMFLGDAGSHLLGFLVAATLLDVPVRGALLLPVLPLLTFVPLAEMCFLVGVRLRKRIAWYSGSSDHFALRLQAAGWSRWRVDLTAWLVMLAVFALGAGFVRGGTATRIAVLLAVGSFCAAAIRFLLRHEVIRRGSA
jgi:UDP-GlcNAc:undecaprenyl-phosphate/decaprenyl-phosphate GlcNAc-1-phosphate transferase